MQAETVSILIDGRSVVAMISRICRKNGSGRWIGPLTIWGKNAGYRKKITGSRSTNSSSQ